jgi:hypothetical protein
MVNGAIRFYRVHGWGLPLLGEWSRADLWFHSSQPCAIDRFGVSVVIFPNVDTVLDRLACLHLYGLMLVAFFVLSVIGSLETTLGTFKYRNRSLGLPSSEGLYGVEQYTSAPPQQLELVAVLDQCQLFDKIADNETKASSPH